MSDPISIRLGPLRLLIEAAAAKDGVPSREWIRQACAEKLGVDAPEMKAGNPDIAKQSAKGVAARLEKKKRK